MKKRYQNILIVTPALLIFSLAAHYIYAADSQRGITIQEKEQPSDVVIEGDYWAFIIGINEYLNLPKDKQLEAARPDAEAVAEILQRKYGVAKERMIPLYDREATRKNIITRLLTLARTLKDKDNLLIYYAGHGVYDETGSGAWVPFEGKLEDPSTFVSNDEVKGYLERIKANHIYTIADSCFSESLMGKTRSIQKWDDSAIKELYQRKSRMVLTSGGLSPVPDKGKGNHSTFAYYFLRILEDNKNQYLTPMQIYSELMPLVTNESRQTPKSAPVALVGDEGGQFIFKNTAYAKIAPPADLKTKEDEVRLKEEQKRLEEERASAKEDLRKYKEELQRQMKEEALKGEQELKAREKKMEEGRAAKELEQNRRLEDEKRRLEQERRDLERRKKEEKKKEEPTFIPPAF
ncbi:MAG: caspase family protein [Deltaproteobacteria bacterium]|nr:caspase family protein [Deltaproteobacteria bacterium]